MDSHLARRFSLLDRLLDDFPEDANPRDPDVMAEERRRYTWEAWRENLRRDLAMLLSTRPPARQAAAGHARAAESIAFHGASLVNAGRERPAAPTAILRAVSTFEPRFREPGLIAFDHAAEPSLVCSLAGWVEWDGQRKDLVVKVIAAGDGWEVEIYE